MLLAAPTFAADALDDAGEARPVSPTDAAPAEAVPTDAVPADAVPTGAAPADAVPTDVAPADAARANDAPADAAQADDAPRPRASDGALPGTLEPAPAPLPPPTFDLDVDRAQGASLVAPDRPRDDRPSVTDRRATARSFDGTATTPTARTAGPGPDFGPRVSPAREAAWSRIPDVLRDCIRFEPGTTRVDFDGACVYDVLRQRYRALVDHQATGRLIEEIGVAGGSARRTETRLECSIDRGRVSIRTPGRRFREWLGRSVTVRSGEGPDHVRDGLDTWLAPHAALALDDPDGSAPRITGADAVVVDDQDLVRLELELHDDEVVLFVDPDTLLVERVTGRRSLPDGGFYASDLVLEHDGAVTTVARDDRAPDPVRTDARRAGPGDGDVASDRSAPARRWPTLGGERGTQDGDGTVEDDAADAADSTDVAIDEAVDSDDVTDEVGRTEPPAAPADRARSDRMQDDAATEPATDEARRTTRTPGRPAERTTPPQTDGLDGDGFAPSAIRVIVPRGG